MIRKRRNQKEIPTQKKKKKKKNKKKKNEARKTKLAIRYLYTKKHENAHKAQTVQKFDSKT